MQTIHCTSSRLVCRQDNIIDFSQYCNEIAPIEGKEGAEKIEQSPVPRPRVGALALSGWLMDIIASLAVVVMTALFAAAILA